MHLRSIQRYQLYPFQNDEVLKCRPECIDQNFCTLLPMCEHTSEDLACNSPMAIGMMSKLHVEVGTHTMLMHMFKLQN